MLNITVATSYYWYDAPLLGVSENYYNLNTQYHLDLY